MARLFFYGASVEYGYNDPVGGGYPERIRRTFMQEAMDGERPTTVALNFSAPSQPLPPIMDRLAEDVQHYRRGVTVAVLAIGGADSIIRAGETSPKVPYEKFLQSLSELGRICVEQEVWPIFVGPPPIIKGAFQPYAANGDVVVPNVGRQYRQAVIDHAASVGAPYIHTTRLLLEQGYRVEDIVSSDRVHPGVEGHEAIAGIVDGEIRRVLERARSHTQYHENVMPF